MIIDNCNIVAVRTQTNTATSRVGVKVGPDAIASKKNHGNPLPAATKHEYTRELCSFTQTHDVRDDLGNGGRFPVGGGHDWREAKSSYRRLYGME